MRSRLVLAVLAFGLVLASIAVTVRGYAAGPSLLQAPEDSAYIYLPFITRYPSDLPPPLEAAAIGRLRTNPATPSLCTWGTHYLESQDGQVVAWVKSDDVHPVSFDGYLGLSVRVVGVLVSPTENCPQNVKRLVVTDIKPWGQTTPEPPAPTPTPPD